MIMVLYTLIVACIGFATIIEKYEGTTFVGEHIYGAWWFVALWAVLTVAALPIWWSGGCISVPQ